MAIERENMPTIKIPFNIEDEPTLNMEVRHPKIAAIITANPVPTAIVFLGSLVTSAASRRSFFVTRNSCHYLKYVLYGSLPMQLRSRL